MPDPIYIQIANRICDDILAGILPAGHRLPSVREYGALVQVNPNTVMRTYEMLSRDGIIFNRRGIGFFVADNAQEAVRQERTRQFLHQQLPQVFTQLKLLDISPAQLYQLYSDFLEK